MRFIPINYNLATKKQVRLYTTYWLNKSGKFIH
jgi:hypothetical protein